MKKIIRIVLVLFYSFFSLVMTLVLGDSIFGQEITEGVQSSKGITVIISILFTVITSYLLYKNAFKSNTVKKSKQNLEVEVKKEIKSKNGLSLLEFPNEYIVFDLETTGFSGSSDEIIEIGAIKVSNGLIIGEFNELVKPELPISKLITGITGITNSMVKNSDDISSVSKRFDHFVGDQIVVAHNAKFDVEFVSNSFDRVGLRTFKNDYIDTLELSKILIENIENYKLETLIKYFKFEDSKGHRAMTDTLNTHKLFLELKKINNQNPNLLPNSLKLSNKPKINYRDFERLNMNDIKSEVHNDLIDEENYFYKLNVCLSGSMDILSKQEIAQKIANLGGQMQNTVTLKTDVLILGNLEKQIKDYGSKSVKHRRALEIIDNGKSIDIYTEKEFIEIVGVSI